MPTRGDSVVGTMLTYDACEVLQLTLSLSKLSEHVGTGYGVTVTAVVQVFVPPGPTTVSAYEVLTVGATVIEPAATGVTVPMP